MEKKAARRPMKGRTRYICTVGIIAALYAALTLLVAPISYGPMQVRISECLCVLPYFTTAAVPGLFFGCLLSNCIGIVIGSSLGVMDVIVGSLATLVAAWLASRTRVKWLVPLPAVLVNALAVPWTLQVMLGVPYWFGCAWVAAGQGLACYGIGLPLLLVLQRNRRAIFQ